MKWRAKGLFKAQNDLERYLMEAAFNPSSRSSFYRELKRSVIFLITQPEDTTSPGAIKAGEKLSIRSIEVNGKPHIAIFSSMLRLQEFINEEVSYATMNAADFFNLTKGSDVFLNPGSDYGKQFSISEVESIIDGSILDSNRRHKVENETGVAIGRPANPPTELLNELCKLFMTLKEVKSAYNVHFFNPTDGVPPHTLIAIETSGNWDYVMTVAGAVANRVAVPAPPVDFIQLNATSHLGVDLRAKYQPFYECKVLGT